MAQRKDRLGLGAIFHPTGHHVAAWLHPGAQIDAGTNFRHYADLARMVEDAKFDFVFLADALATRKGNMAALSRWPQYMAYFEPTTLLSALAALTQHIGLVATATTSFNAPYDVARRFASLDHISGGRAGWNVVTSSNRHEAANFGLEQMPEHDARYVRAREFAAVVKGLWDSWDDDAFLRDRKSGLYFDPDKLHVLGHKGPDFSVEGPLNIARPPQGHPVIFQAGSSGVGRDFAAETAEVIFTVQQKLDGARAFYQDIKERAAKFGRDPSGIRVYPGLNVCVAESETEAREKWDALQALIQHEVGCELLANEMGGFDLSSFPADGPLPVDQLPKTVNSSQHMFNLIVETAQRENLTIRQLYQRFAGGRGQRTVIGTPAQVVDGMQEWFEAEAADGFLIQPPVLPEGLADFTRLVIPELHRRGLIRTEYEGRTLRDHLGLARPKSRYAG